MTSPYKNYVQYFLSIIHIGLLCLGTYANALSSDIKDASLSPYFFIEGQSSDIDSMPLESTDATVNIVGVIADVVITQTYQNKGKKSIEAVYIFPGSTRAAVYGMKMTIGDRTIIAEIREREEARNLYEAAKNAGQTASLLEQQRPNVFQMNVANILPGDKICVELRYTELLISEERIYEFVFPTVVGPRYGGEVASQNVKKDTHQWIKNPYLHESTPPTSRFTMHILLSGGLPIQQISCSSHAVSVHYQTPDQATIDLHPSDTNAGNKDFILNYSLADQSISTGVLLYKGNTENYFLSMIHPPKHQPEKWLPPRDYIFVIDVSGSMNGFPLDTTKELMKRLLQDLKAYDSFNIMLFAGNAYILSKQSLPATQENIYNAIQLINRQKGGGGTQLLDALEKVFGLPQQNGARTIIVITDGYISVELKVFDLIRHYLDQVNVFTFGIGTSVNRYLIEGMARVGMGLPFIVTKPEEALPAVNRFFKYVSMPVLTNIRVSMNQFNAYDVIPSHIPDVFAERPIIIIGKWKTPIAGDIQINGLSGKGVFNKQINMASYSPSESNAALKYLWARHYIAALCDDNHIQPTDQRKQEIINTGIQFNLLTPFTSFVAIDHSIRSTDGKPVTVKQPLPLPQGVSDLAVGRKKMRSLQTTMAETTNYAWKVEKESLNQDLASQHSHATVIHNPKKMNVTGLISPQALNLVIEKHMREIQSCYQTYLSNDSSIKGNALLRVTINSDGKPISIKLISKDFNLKTLTDCIQSVVSRWKFPSYKDGRAITVVDYWLTFKP